MILSSRSNIGVFAVAFSPVGASSPIRVSAPLFVKKSTGLNDNLSGIEKPVSFNIQSGENEEQFEIVQSLAKWKRVALHKYNFKENTGLYTDMNAIRPSETLDNIHSLYVDQWDWEKVISEKDRNLTFLHDTIKKIYKVFLMTEDLLLTSYPNHKKLLPENLFILSSKNLRMLYLKILLKKEKKSSLKIKERSLLHISEVN